MTTPRKPVPPIRSNRADEKVVAANDVEVDPSSITGITGTDAQTALEQLSNQTNTGQSAAQVDAKISAHQALPNAHHTPPALSDLVSGTPQAGQAVIADAQGNAAWGSVPAPSGVLTSVDTDTSINGDGTSGSPLSVARPFGGDDTVTPAMLDADTQAKQAQFRDRIGAIHEAQLGPHADDVWMTFNPGSTLLDDDVADRRGQFSIVTNGTAQPTGGTNQDITLASLTGDSVRRMIWSPQAYSTGVPTDTSVKAWNVRPGETWYAYNVNEIDPGANHLVAVFDDSTPLTVLSGARQWAWDQVEFTEVGNLQGVSGQYFHWSKVKPVTQLVHVGQIPDLIPGIISKIAGTRSSTNKFVTVRDANTLEYAAGGTGGGTPGTQVTANPTGTTTNDLDKISIAGVDYNVLDSPILRGDPQAFQVVYAPSNTTWGAGFAGTQRGFFQVSANSDMSSPFANWNTVTAGTRYGRMSVIGYTVQNRGTTVTTTLVNGIRHIEASLGDGAWTITGIRNVVMTGGVNNPYITFEFILAKTGNFNGNSGIVRSVVPDSADDLQVDIDEVNGLRSELELLHEQDTAQDAVTAAIPRVYANPTPRPSGVTTTPLDHVRTSESGTVRHFSVLAPADFNPHADWYGEYSDAHLSDPAGLWTLDDATGRSKQGYFSFHATKPTEANSTTTAPIAPDRIETANGIWLNLHLNQFNLNYGNVNQAYVTLPSTDFETNDVIVFRNRNTATVYTFTVTGNYETQNTGLRANLRNSVVQGNLVRSGPQTELLVARVSDQLHRSFPVHVLPTETGIVDPTTNEIFPNLIPPAGRAAEPAAPTSGTVNYLQRLVRSTTGSVVSWVNENLFQPAIRNPDSTATPAIPDSRLEAYQVKGQGGFLVDLRADPHLGEIVGIRADGTEATPITPSQVIADHINIPKGTVVPTVAPGPNEEPLYLQEVTVTSGSRRPRKWTDIPGWSSDQLGFTQGRTTRFTGDPYEVGANNERVWGSWERWPNSNPLNGRGIVETYMAWQCMADLASSGSTTYVSACDTYLQDYYYKLEALQFTLGSYNGKAVCGSSTEGKIFTGAPGDDTPPTIDYRIGELVVRNSAVQRDGVDTVKYYRISHVSGTNFDMVEDQNDPRFYEQPTTSIVRTLWFHDGTRWEQVSYKHPELIATFDMANKNFGGNSIRTAQITLSAAGTREGYSIVEDGSGNTQDNLVTPIAITNDRLAYYMLKVYWGTTLVGVMRVYPRADGGSDFIYYIRFQKPGTTGASNVVTMQWNMWRQYSSSQNGWFMYFRNNTGSSSDVFPASSKCEFYEVHD